jgi:hypothetical protein
MASAVASETNNPAAGAAASSDKPALKVTHFILHYEAPGGCFASDRMRDSYPQWVEGLGKEGITVTLNRTYGPIPHLHVAAGGDEATRWNVWAVDGEACAKSGCNPAWDYPWQAPVAAKLKSWAESGSPPEGTKQVGQ